MSVNNVYNNKVNIVKAAMTKQAQKSAQAAKPEYMKMTGSIFNAPGATTKTTGTITDLNTRRSIDDLNNGSKTTVATSTNNSSSSSIESIENIDNASDGKAAANDAEAKADNVRSLTSDTQKDATTVNKFSSDAVKLDEKITKDNKKYEKQLQKQEKELKQDNAQLEKVVKETEDAQKEIDDAANELESLLGSNSFSINGQDGGSSSNSDRIKELQTIIGSKTAVVQSHGKVIYSIQRNSARTLKQMGQTNKAYIRTQNTNQKNIEENQSKTDKVIEVATTIEQVSALVSQVGQAVNYAGQALVALGSSTSWLGGAGAALISVGTVMQKIGNVTDMVGQYGQAAANVTKTAAYAADGNLAGALQSAAAAIQTGTAAGKSTADLKKNFASIDAAAEQATQKAAANQAAKDIVDQKIESGEGLGGMTEKQARKAVSSDLQNQMANGDITFADGLSRKDKITNFTQNATNKSGQSGAEILNNSFSNAQTNFTDTLTNQGLKFDSATGKIVDSTGKEVSKKTKKSVNNAFSGTFKNAGTKAAKSSENFWDKFQKWGTSLQNAAALYSAYGNQQNNNTQTNTVPDFYFDQRTLDIMAKNQRRRAAIGAM